MEIRLVRMDSSAATFANEFEALRVGFLNVIASSYTVYYGDSYQMDRMISGDSILYACLADGEVVGASYVKANLRRGATAVFPERFRRTGIAEAMVQASFTDFPAQYTILRANNHGMIRLLVKLNFHRVESPADVLRIAGEEGGQLHDFEAEGSHLVFGRRSVRRDTERESLTMLYRSR